MAAERSSLKRKPLSDCTNTVSSRSNTVRRKTSLRSALNQPQKTSSESNYENPIGSLKSNTSTGSNNPPVSETARSTLLPASYGSENRETKKRNDNAKVIVEDTTVVQPDHQETIKRKDKGKAVAEDTPVIQLDQEETRKRKDKGKAIAEDTLLIQPDHQEIRKWKDKGKAVVDYTVAIQPDPQEISKRKDKGKAVVEDTVVILSDDEEAKRRKDKGKAIVEDTAVVLPDHQETIKKKDKGKTVIEDTTVFQPDPPSPTVSGSNYNDLFKYRTVYTRKRAPEARNLRSLKITEPFSCPPLKRLKFKGKQVDAGGGDDKSVKWRKSFPVQKKKSRGKSKHEAAVGEMPKEEVEKLRAYYADIDAFELDVEEAKGYDSD